tara:strand:+ start:162 stop:482 length:321 start_codon:yes stop_codon:yes gene_type:complete
MHKKKIILLLVLTYLVSSCGGTWDSVKRGLTGAKSKSTDEFLVKKKDPLVLPPDYDKLPTPDEQEEIIEDDIEDIRKTLKKTDSTQSDTSSGSSTEQSILEKIRTR